MVQLQYSIDCQYFLSVYYWANHVSTDYIEKPQVLMNSSHTSDVSVLYRQGKMGRAVATLKILVKIDSMKSAYME